MYSLSYQESAKKWPPERDISRATTDFSTFPKHDKQVTKSKKFLSELARIAELAQTLQI